ncbi:hypothetical protein [Vibrio brasiliensis]|uniref:hypothetical protein n=1 Tax=Vibrio brasiliensis TaxID=170652 RepID=UPI001EFCC051|nr:hypothetical protein [Vibrio brasiliensis]MCG9727441.1 hypothetical protein [Vibrio brasiliensis]
MVRFFLSSISLSILIPLFSLLAFYLFVNTPEACFFPDDAWSFLGEIGGYLAGIGTILLVVAGTDTARRWQKDKLYQLLKDFDKQLDRFEIRLYSLLSSPRLTEEGSIALYYVNGEYIPYSDSSHEYIIKGERRKLSNIAYAIALFLTKSDTDALINELETTIEDLDKLIPELLSDSELNKGKIYTKLSSRLDKLRTLLEGLKTKFL